MAAHPQPIVSYKLVINRIAELEERLDEIFEAQDLDLENVDYYNAESDELHEELIFLETTKRAIWKKFRERQFFLRLLKVIDNYSDPQDVPVEFVEEAERIVEEMGQSVDIVKAAVVNRAIRLRLINNFKRLNNMFMQNELDLEPQNEKLKDYIDSEVERRLLQNPPDPEMIARLSGENGEFIKDLRNRILGNQAGVDYMTVAILLQDLSLPDIRAQIYARLGDYAGVHRELDAGSKRYGHILAAVRPKGKNRSPLWSARMGDRRLLTLELVDRIAAEQNMPGHRYEVENGEIFQISHWGNRKTIGKYNTKWLGADMELDDE